MRLALLASIALTLGACTLKVSRLDPVGQSISHSYAGSEGADEIQGSLLHRTQAIRELHHGTPQQFQDPGALYSVPVLGVNPELQLLDPRFDPTLDPMLFQDPRLGGPTLPPL